MNRPSVPKPWKNSPRRRGIYIEKIEELVGAPIDIISTGPDRVETIILRHPFEA